MRRVGGAVACALALAAAGCSSSSHHAQSANANANARTSAAALTVKVVSSRPDMVTGESALLQIDGGTGTPTATAGATSLTVTPVKKWWRVDGLPNGPSTINVQRGSLHASAAVTDYSVKGPVFSGPHMPLLACSTVANGLGPATDSDCSAPTKVDEFYVTTSGAMKPITGTGVPAGVRRINIHGHTIPFIVRRERGVINRSVYWIDVVDSDGVSPADLNAADGWNGRLVYRFGGGCGTTYGQGTPITSADAPEFLALGYAVTTATFNTFQVQCNDVLSAETAMMVKSHFINEFGVPVHTIGEGASGGSIQQHLIVQNYPGILDGVVAELPFPDATTVAAGVSDCGLLDRYYTTPAGVALTSAQRAAINGHAVPGTCDLWVSSFLEGIRPSDGCDPQIPASQIYNAQTNRRGIRCDLVDSNVNELGRDPNTGFAQRPLDNVGVQYGLQALNDKVITVDQFLALNAAIGGYDIDGKMVPQRETATTAALQAAYGKGRVSEGGGDQKVVPIIDLNLYDDFAGDIHDRFRAFSLRDRLGSPNQVIWTRGSAVTSVSDVIGNIVSGGGGAGNDAVPAMDEWLTTGTMPANAADNCLGKNGQVITGPDLYETPGPCRDGYPLHGDPRTAAGAPRRNDIIKCRLKPIATSDYKVPFTPAQQARLAQIFPSGVCDWSKASVGFVPLEGTWLRY